jgi:hypothetical protein
MYFNLVSLNLRHLRDEHCSQEGGSFVCRYGYNGVCTSLPVEGVSDKDYEDHVMKHHTKTQDGKDTGIVSELKITLPMSNPLHNVQVFCVG